MEAEAVYNSNQNEIIKTLPSPSSESDDEDILANHEPFEQIPTVIAFLSLLGFYILIFLGFVNQFLFSPKTATDKKHNGYGSIYDKFEMLYLNYVYRRICDGWNRPVSSVPGAEITLKDRVSDDYNWNLRFSGTETKCINLGSYNYLGFAQSHGPCAEDSIQSLRNFGYSFSSCRRELGTGSVHIQLEKLMARFLGVDDCITFGMGFATNALGIPGIVTNDCLVLSDERNHASVILGLKLSKATLWKYKHNDMEDLEQKLIKAMELLPRMANPWKKIFICCEGVFSMEGSIGHLSEIIALKKKYKAYLYLDEAHSIGAIGPTGRGVIDHYNCDPKDVDILMGTFTKSFGSAGGYIAGSKKLINHLRQYSDAVHYCASMSPPVAQQIITSLKIIMGDDGTSEGVRRIQNLRENTRYFRNGLRKLGLIVYGHEESPVVPVIVYFNSKVIMMIRDFMKDFNIATAGVGFPATPLLQCRMRFCLSAAHTKEQLQKVLEATDIIADKIGIRYSKNWPAIKAKRKLRRSK